MSATRCVIAPYIYACLLVRAFRLVLTAVVTMQPHRRCYQHMGARTFAASKRLTGLQLRRAHDLCL